MKDQNYIAATENIGLVDLKRSWIEVRGADSKNFLNGRLTNNVTALQNSGCYSLLLTPKGKLIADLFCYPCGDLFGIDCNTSIKEKVLEELKRYIIFQKVELIDQSNRWGTLCLIGPKAKSFLETVVSKLPQKEMEYVSNEVEGDLFDVILKKLWGFPAFEIWVRKETIEKFKAILNLPTIDRKTQEVLRVESATPLFGVDMDENTIPLEANLQNAISFDKGCYVGQEIIARIHYRGHVGKQLVQIKIESFEPPKAGERIFSAEGEEIGFVTSSCFSPKFGAPIALAYLKYSFLNSPTIKVGSYSATKL